MKKSFSTTFSTILAIVAGFIGGLVAALLLMQSQFFSSNNSSSKTEVSQVSYQNATDTTKAVSTVQNAVVSVINYKSQSGSGYENFFGNNAQNQDEMTVYSEGSGVIYKKENGSAYVVTNNHVIDGAEQIEIMFSDGSKVVGKLVGSDTYSDLAVVKIADDNVKTVADFADSDKLTVGETAIAIGSPLGTEYANSVTQGIVSSLSRTVTMQNENGETVSTNAIQTDAAINPGNSGGALINIEGQVIGINSSKISTASDSSAVEGMGFAIPANDVVKIINQLEENGQVIRPALGIQMASLSELSTNITRNLKLPDDVTSGIVIGNVQEGMPADGKLEKYDVIIKVDDTEVSTPTDLQSALYGHNIGDTIEVTLYRNGKKQTISITLNKSTQELK